MIVAITTQKELKNPHLQLDINLEAGTVFAVLTYTCPKCEGYGCMGGGCDNRILLKPHEIIQTLGPEAKSLLSDLLNGCLTDGR